MRPTDTKPTAEHHEGRSRVMATVLFCECLLIILAWNKTFGPPAWPLLTFFLLLYVSSPPFFPLALSLRIRPSPVPVLSSLVV